MEGQEGAEDACRVHRTGLGCRQDWGPWHLDGDGSALGRVSRFGREKLAELGPGAECRLGQRKRCPKGLRTLGQRQETIGEVRATAARVAKRCRRPPKGGRHG